MLKKSETARQAREVHFYKGGTKIHPRTIFEDFYSPLDRLITANKEKGKFRNRNFPGDKSADQKLIREVFAEVVAPRRGFSATIKFDSNAEGMFMIDPRTNYYPTLTKRPNIVYLHSTNDGGIFILRESRNDMNNKDIESSFRSQYGQHVVSADVSNAEDREKVGNKDIVLIPEPFLVLTLESLVASKTADRITPELKVIGANTDYVWAIRDFLPFIGDTNFGAEHLINYIGVLHGLGLIDTYDIQEAHYCIQGRRVVNIDPDRCVYTACDNILNSKGWGDLKYLFILRVDRGSQPLLFGDNFKEYGKQRIKVIEQTRRSMGGKTLMDFIPSKLSEAPVLANIGVDNRGDFTNIG